MTREYDVYLDGEGYMLGRRADGQLQSGAAREQATDPFTRYVSSGDRWARAVFRFGDGGGLAQYDGSHRYRSGEFVDTRGGWLTVGPDRELCDDRSYDTERIVNESDTLEDLELSTGNFIGYGERFQVPAGRTGIRNVQVLVKRDPDTDYTGAGNFQVLIQQDAAGPKPGAVVGTVWLSPVTEPDPWQVFTDRWRNGDYFWLEGRFNASLAVTPGNWYWICVSNNQAPEVYWAEVTDGQGRSASETRSHYTAGAWVNGYSDYPIMFKVKYNGQIDAFPRCFCQYRGVDGVERMFAGVGAKVMYYDEAAGTWTNSVVLAAGTEPVLQLLEFNSLLFAAVGDGVNAVYYDGTTETTNWVGLGEDAQCFAIHDNLLWKADGRAVEASATGTAGAWGANVVNVGDPGTAVQSLVSHGGKLYAGKPEGIFEIDYPSTYPGAGTPTANLMLDFRTERGVRMWLQDWHSGLYFPGQAGVYELKSGVLRNIWTEKVDEGSVEIGDVSRVFTKPRRWGPHYDADPGGWMSCCGGTRSLMLSYTGPHLRQAGLWWYDSSNWHELTPGYVYYVGYLTYHELGEYCLGVYLEDRGGGKGRLWYGYGDNIGAMYLPTWTNRRWQDDGVDYWLDSPAWCVLPEFVLPDSDQEVDYFAVGVSMNNAGAGAGGQATVDYLIDSADTWTTLGTFDEDYEEVAFPADTRGRKLTMRIRLWPANDYDVMVESLVLLYQPLPDTVRTFQVIVTVADLVEKKNGSPDKTRTAADLAVALEALLEEEEPWTYEDVRGVQHSVRAMGVTVQEMRLIEAPGPLGYRFESQAVVTMLEVA